MQSSELLAFTSSEWWCIYHHHQLANMKSHNKIAIFMFVEKKEKVSEVQEVGLNKIKTRI